MKKNFFAICAIIGFVLLKFSLLPALELRSYVYPSLVLILFCTIILSRNASIVVALVVGVIDEIFSFRLPPGFFLIIYLLLVYWVDYLINTFFTNRSPYTLFIVSAIGALSISFFEQIFLRTAYLFNLLDKQPVLHAQLARLWIQRLIWVPTTVLFFFIILQKTGIVHKAGFLTYGKRMR